MPSALLYVMTKRTSKFFFTKSYGFILEQTCELGFRELKIQDSVQRQALLCFQHSYISFGKIISILSLMILVMRNPSRLETILKMISFMSNHITSLKAWMRTIGTRKRFLKSMMNRNMPTTFPSTLLNFWTKRTGKLLSTNFCGLILQKDGYSFTCFFFNNCLVILLLMLKFHQTSLFMFL